jgi:hypothetical protein
MKSFTFAASFAIAAVALLTLSAVPAANAQDRGCSDASLHGTFAYTSTGTIVAPAFVAGPYAEVGTQTFNGNGSVTFTLNTSQNGNVGPGTATGSYKVNSDCTGTFTETSNGFTSHFTFVIDDNWNGIQAICQDQGAVITRIGRRIYPESNQTWFRE